ncbi:MAG TPA: two-component regulator propeller domain-containing protein, partial [Pedobacter sp.]
MHYKTTKRSSNLLLHFIIWACIALTCQYTPAFAQQNKQYNFRHIDQRDGLLHNSVFAIAQDQTGFMWIGSRNGLQRYDGLRFISYQKELAPLSFAALITNLHPDGKGNIWVTTTQLAKLHAASKQLTIYDSTVLQNPAFKFDTYIDEHNEAWLLGSCGLFYRDSVSKKMKQYAPALPVYTSNFGTAVFYDKVTKNAWTAGPYGLRLFDYKTKKVYTHNYNPGNNPVLQLFDNKNISCMLIDKNGDFWLSTWEGELINYNAVTKKKRHYALASIPREGNKKRGTVSVNCLYRDSKGNLWIGTDNMGLLQYNSRDDNITQIQAKDDQQQGVQFNYSFFCITEDKDGNLWLGTDKGISIFNPYYPYFQTITHQENNKASLPKSEINAILNGSNGDIYIGTWGGGFSIYDSALSFKKTIIPNGVFELPLTWSFAESDDKMIWVGAQHGYIHVYNPATGNFKTIHPPEMENITIRCIKKDGEGNLWFGLHNGKIVKWDRRSASFFSSVTNSSVINPNPVLNLFIDRRNHFWVCTDNGILEFDQSKLQYIGNYSPATNSTLVKNNTTLMRGVEQMNDSTLAVGSMRNGVFFFNTRTKEFNRNPILSSLNSANVYALKNDPDHNLWITSDYQLHQLRSTDNTLRSYKIQSGILNSSFENLNFYTLQNGLLATSTFTEAIIFDPSILNAASQLNEAVLVTGFKIFDKEIFIDSTIAAGRPVKLNYDQNFISLQFTTLSYSGIEETVFYYKLSEVDKDWVKTDA